MAAIEAEGLKRTYKTTTGALRRKSLEIEAVRGIDFQVGEGELFGLLGPNGAGKTTSVKILLGLTHATSGEAVVHDLPVSNPESRRRVGYLPEGHKIPGYLTARQTLSIFGRMSGMESADILRRGVELLEQLRI